LLPNRVNELTFASLVLIDEGVVDEVSKGCFGAALLFRDNSFDVASLAHNLR